MSKGIIPGLIGRSARNEEIRSSGLLRSPVAGRTDRLPMGVHPNSYVIPADVVSGLGQGNTISGGHMLDHMFGSMKPMKTGHTMPHAPKGMMSTGGATHKVPVMVAGGEYIVHPDIVAHIGEGSHRKGHRILDTMVKNVRHHTIKTLKGLPAPKR